MKKQSATTATPFIEQANAYCIKEYGITSDDIGLDEETAKEAIAANETPQQWVDAKASKYNLNSKREFNWGFEDE